MKARTLQVYLTVNNAYAFNAYKRVKDDKNITNEL